MVLVAVVVVVAAGCLNLILRMMRILMQIHNSSIIFCEGNPRLFLKIAKGVNYFCKNDPSQMFDWVLNTPLIAFLKNLTEFPRKYPWQCFFGSFLRPGIL